MGQENEEEEHPLERAQLDTRVNIRGSEFHIPLSESMPSTEEAHARCIRPPALQETGETKTAVSSTPHIASFSTATMETKVPLKVAPTYIPSSSPVEHLPQSARIELQRKDQQLAEQESIVTRQRRELDEMKREIERLRAQVSAKTQETPDVVPPPPPTTAGTNEFPPQKLMDHHVLSSNNTIPGEFGGAPPAIAKASNEASALINQHRAQLRKLFDSYANGGSIVFASFLELAVDFDLHPTFLDKAEIQLCFDTGTSSSTHATFDDFVSALYQLANDALSKKMFEGLYPRDVDKVGVVLTLWGLADPQKLAQIMSRKRLLNAN